MPPPRRLLPACRRDGAGNDSSGFEHVFVGESDEGKISGFHNWVQASGQAAAPRGFTCAVAAYGKRRAATRKRRRIVIGQVYSVRCVTQCLSRCAAMRACLLQAQPWHAEAMHCHECVTVSYIWCFMLAVLDRGGQGPCGLPRIHPPAHGDARNRHY